MATRLLVSCLGIEAEPGFDLTDPDDRNLATRKPKALGECLFKDAFCESMGQESWHLQLLVVDEKRISPVTRQHLGESGETRAGRNRFDGQS
jgi:hypothetical protein